MLAVEVLTEGLVLTVEALAEAALADAVLPGQSEETVQTGDDAGGTAVEPSGEGATDEPCGEGEALAVEALAGRLVLAA